MTKNATKTSPNTVTFLLPADFSLDVHWGTLPYIFKLFSVLKMSQIPQLDLENIGRNIRSKKMGVAKIVDGKSRKCLQPLENQAVPKAKRVKLDEPLQTVILFFFFFVGVKVNFFKVEESDQEQSPQQLKYLFKETEQSNKVALKEDNTAPLPDPLLYIAEYKQVRQLTVILKMFDDWVCCRTFGITCVN